MKTRPYIVSHMVASIDGRIDCSMVEKISGDEYYTTLELACVEPLANGTVWVRYTLKK